MLRERHAEGYSRLLRIFLVVSASLLILALPAFAETIVLTRIIDEIESLDMASMENVKLSASLKTDKKGDLVVRCLNLFSIPVAEKPFETSPVLKKLMERTELQVRHKGEGFFVKIALTF